MACLQKLREDISLLQELFPKTHERFQVISASVDEISVKFLDSKGKSVRIYANIQEDYPEAPPLWFSECDDPQVAGVLEQLTDSTSILRHIHQLITMLCDIHGVPSPSEISRLVHKLAEIDEGKDEDEPAESGDMADDQLCEIMDLGLQSNVPLPSGDDEPSAEVEQILSRVQAAQYQRRVNGGTSSPMTSVAATNRLMKELKEIYRSENIKKGAFSVELKDDNIYEWMIQVKQVDKDSALWADLMKLKETTGQDHLLFHMVFKDSYPFEPPFVRLVSPTVLGGYVHGGALCMELLMKHGWTSAYGIEPLIMQIAATLVKGRARIVFDAKNTYSLTSARHAFSTVVSIHEQHGWGTLPEHD